METSASTTTTTTATTTGLEIAIIGMSGRFPGASTIEQFWQNLQEGRESITFFTNEELERAGVDPALFDSPTYVKACGVMENVELFDAAFFGISPHEARLMDPQHRFFLECCWEALEAAGYYSQRYEGNIGVFGGVGFESYLFNYFDTNRRFNTSAEDYQIFLNHGKDFLATRVAYKFGLRGPAMTILTACSTSLVAVHVACQSLLSGESDMALAGGVAIRVPQTGYVCEEGSVISPEGHCYAFDARACGTVVGSGVGVVLLKRLEDALADHDTIYAVIKGSAVNNDGDAKAGYTAPGVEGQIRVIQAAHRMAEVSPDSISYVEAHGTGTILGDPIEVTALTQAFRNGTRRTQFCALGSLKTNIGHLDTAAGVASLIKTALALKHRLLPPSLNFETPNPRIDFAQSPFSVNTTLTPWEAGGSPLRAGVSAFGFGGTNVHVVLEEAPAAEPFGSSRSWHLLPLSARSGPALDAATANLAEHLQHHPGLNLADVAYTLQVGRRPFDHRRAVVGRSPDDALDALRSGGSQRVMTGFCPPSAGERSLVFLFPGQGAQYVRMALDLYRAEPHVRQQVDTCATLLLPHLGQDLRTLLYPPPRPDDAGMDEDGEDGEEEATRRINQTEITQPAIFVIEYALASLWMEWGVRPQAMLGHSIGEFVAACLAGVMSLEDALMLVAMRGKLMQRMPHGTMLSVALPPEEVRELLGEDLSLSAVNTPAQSVVGGPTAAIDRLEKVLTTHGVEYRRLHTSHAFHSQMMEPMLEPFAAYAQRVKFNHPGWL
ncbi:MAG: type I polyketide synthase, partial [Chloroflexaceae bacterium]|nr:type I polyketide synthase [Chloroflexaceae bacterium]